MKLINKTLLASIAAASLATISAQANVVSGTVWETFSQYLPGGTTDPTQSNDSQGQLDATFANVATLMSAHAGGDVTFHAPSNPLFFSSYGPGLLSGNPTADYTIGSWLGTGGATSVNFIHGT